jgi:hypothetical protein
MLPAENAAAHAESQPKDEKKLNIILRRCNVVRDKRVCGGGGLSGGGGCDKIREFGEGTTKKKS